MPPKSRRKPTDVTTDYETDYNTQDGIPHKDEQPTTPDYVYKGDQLTVTAQTDIELAGQPDTRQSTSSYILSFNGIIFHWRAHTEKVIIRTTAAGGTLP